ncbi:virulence factor TspB C-terminal domain-related protein [Acidovorax sp.]|uniref:virulence factor TspB C-terminal domain-related protein n=1 Tax=Acidovorax sp. TaxID=1872122 RepID=UPI0031E26BF3
MVHLYRIVLGLLMACAVSSAFATINAVPRYQYFSFVGTAGEIVAYQQAQENPRGCGYGSGKTTYQISARNQTAQSVEIWYSSVCSDSAVPPSQGLIYTAPRVGYICPENSTLSGTTCTCSSGFEENNGQCKRPACPAGQHEEGGACVPDDCKPDETRVNGVCVKDPPCPAGETRINGVCKKNGCEKGKNVGIFDTQGESATFFCEGGCQVRVMPSTCVRYEGVVQCAGSGIQTGSSCTSAGEGPGSTNPGTGPTDGGGGTGDGGTGNGGTGNGGTGTGGGGTGTGTGGGGTGTGSGGTGSGGTGSGGTGSGGTGSGGTGSGGTGSGGTGSGGTGSGGTGSGSGTNGPGYPPPIIIPPAPDGTCPTGTHKSGNTCIKDPVPPDGDGKCPEGSVKINGKCVYTEPPSGGGGGTGTGGGGTGSGNGDGDGEDGSGFGGSCMSGFACEGDAIQCAIAKEQYARNCKLFDDTSAESDLYNANKGKTGNQTGDLPGNETISLSGRIDTSDPLGGGGCIGDLSVTVWGHGVSLPLSNLCQYLAMLGNILVAVSMLMAARIVTRG